MNIVLLADAWKPLTGGGQKLFWELVCRLVKDHGHHLTVITRALKHNGKHYHKPEIYFSGRLTILRLKPSLPWNNLFGRLWFTVQSAAVALKAKPDLYLASTFLPAFSLQIIKLFRKTPQALVVIGLSGKKMWLEKIITETFRYSLVITDDINYFKLMQNIINLAHIPNGVDLPKASKASKNSRFTFLFVGRNEPRKGVKYLREAFTKIKAHYPQARLVIIGPGFKTVSSLSLHHEMFSAHCLVLPSIWEGHPLIVFEAFAHKLPVIATNVGSVSLYVTPKTGWLVPPGDATALYKAMLNAINANNLSQLGENGYQLVKAKYTWRQTALQYHQAITSLLQ